MFNLTLLKGGIRRAVIFARRQGVSFQRSVFLYRTIAAICIGLVITVALTSNQGHTAPLLANYYLGTLPTDDDSIQKLAHTDVLVLSPEQAVINRAVIDKIRKENPHIILLAYVSSKSVNDNWQSFPANTIYHDFQVQDSWWLRDTHGNIVSNWPGLKSANMSQAWSDYLINFVKTKIISQGIWDGIFWDEVYDGIATVNGGDIDLFGSGQRTDGATANAEWVNRINYLLQKSRDELGVRYIVTNGSSLESMQPLINGRMYENYPTPWEQSGNWNAIMTKLAHNQPLNALPHLDIINANTNNTGKRDDFRRMRFGLASSLLLDDTYYSFDYGDQNHAQVWWYDEYDVKLGNATGPAQSLSGKPLFEDGVWRRDFQNGVVLVNATAESQPVDLGGEYEKIIGKQDPAVNDGSIVDQVTLGARDAILMYKTFQTVTNVFIKNGAFVRFFRPDGSRARNGFFVYDTNVAGGAMVYTSSSSTNSVLGKIVATGPHLDVFNNTGQTIFSDDPFGDSYTGDLNVAVGHVMGKQDTNIVVAPANGNKIEIYDAEGTIVKRDWYPFGKKYQGSFSVAVGDIDGDGLDEIIVGTAAGKPAQVSVFSKNFDKPKKQFYPFDKKYKGGVNVAVGDFYGTNAQEVAVVSRSDRHPMVRLFDARGKKMGEFAIKGFFGNQIMTLGAADVSFAGHPEIVVMSDN